MVLEAEEVVGGLAGSFEVAGIRVDHGSHRLHQSVGAGLRRELEELLGDDLQRRPRHGRLRLGDRWVEFPLRPGDLARRLPPRFALGAARDVLAAPFRRQHGDSFSEVVRAGLGPTMLAWFYGPYARKLWGAEGSELAGELARRRIGGRSPSRLLRRISTDRERSRWFLYPRRGFGQICEALADAAVQAGVEIHLGSRVGSVGPDSGRVVSSDGRSWEAGAVWSTLPVTQLVHMVDPPADQAVLRVASSLGHRAMVLVYLVLGRSRYTDHDAHYFPALGNPVSRLSEPKNYRESAEDPEDRTVLCAEIPCSEGDEVWGADEGELARLVADALTAEGLDDPKPSGVEVRRIPRAYPVYRIGFEQHLEDVESWIRDRQRLLTLGRQGLFVADNTHHVLEMGWAAAAALGERGSFDEVAWSHARERFRSHVVED